MYGIIHIVAHDPRELWIDGKDVIRMEKSRPKFEFDGSDLTISYEDGHEEHVQEPVFVEFINSEKKPDIMDEEETEDTPPSGYENDSIMKVYNEMDSMEAADRDYEKMKHPSWNSVHKKGNATRFLSIAKGHNIDTVGQLLKIGSARFARFKYMGPKCINEISKALFTLYDIYEW